MASIARIILITSLLYFNLVARINCSETHDHASSFGFLKGLEGSRKSQKVNGLHKLKNYLARYGYLDNHSINNSEDDQVFDESLENAIKIYQRNYRLNVTGYLDFHTVPQMMKPRCGFPDIINGRNTMQHRQKGRKSRFGGSLYVTGGTQWPPSAYNCTYQIQLSTLSPAANNMNSIVSNVLEKWGKHCPLSFKEVEEGSNSTLVYGFYGGDHGDGNAFDGPGGTLAHAFLPTDGRAHFDSAEDWSENPDQNQFDLESIVLHETGHLLGLDHTNDPNAVMYPYLHNGERKRELQQDDIDGIESIYYYRS